MISCSSVIASAGSSAKLPRNAPTFTASPSCTSVSVTQAGSTTTTMHAPFSVARRAAAPLAAESRSDATRCTVRPRRPSAGWRRGTTDFRKAVTIQLVGRASSRSSLPASTSAAA
ncbi:MAG: hypothetical protein HZA53_02250 [Planctomycetes bacterium]|nr:hypothetical protein [Planctomycetota bacterium]